MAKERANQTRLLSGIKWYLSRGWTRDRVVSQILKRFSYVNTAQMNRLIDHVQSTRQAAGGIKRSGASRIIDSGTLPSLENRPTVVRATVKFTFKSPLKRTPLSIELPFDLPSGLNKTQFFDQLRNLIVNDMMIKYSNRARRDVENRIDNIDLIMVEGV